jgi:hypothetical protein
MMGNGGVIRQVTWGIGPELFEQARTASFISIITRYCYISQGDGQIFCKNVCRVGYVEYSWLKLYASAKELALAFIP